jgi:chromosome partitioning protein
MAAEARIPILVAEIEQRVAFAESLTMGKTIFEWPSGRAAAREIKRLTEEILSHVQEDIHDSAEAKAAHG